MPAMAGLYLDACGDSSAAVPNICVFMRASCDCELIGFHATPALVHDCEDQQVEKVLRHARFVSLQAGCFEVHLCGKTMVASGEVVSSIRSWAMSMGKLRGDRSNFLHGTLTRYKYRLMNLPHGGSNCDNPHHPSRFLLPTSRAPIHSKNADYNFAVLSAICDTSISTGFGVTLLPRFSIHDAQEDHYESLAKRKKMVMNWSSLSRSPSTRVLPSVTLDNAVQHFHQIVRIDNAVLNNRQE
ncbi:hypothetical protein FIBSPDRAFT_882769 [Athelia psychrophila]|uniref:Uncharacterized protein n=1 Tax=Athelia psychrophila TaxID=1759441 RepID=A0A166UNS4_9AGAM|nr:hypothetical protein FIBSPDRAFT_882769 [Fibularhizoctonia sp. CBS 109695]